MSSLDKTASNNGQPLQQGAFQRALRGVLNDTSARWAVVILVALYIMVGLANFFAPYSEHWHDRSLANAPPTTIYLRSVDGQLRWPYVLKQVRTFNKQALEYTYHDDTSTEYPVQLFAQGEPYRLFGILSTDRHLLGVSPPARLSLLGNDMNGRDIFSRTLFGGRISLTIGFLSLFVAFPLGLLYGGISGYFGGWLDTFMMRFAEVMMSIPSLYLLITLAAIIPSSLSSTQRFALVVVSLASIGWAGFSRVIRGMVLSIRKQEFVEASRALGKSHLGIIIDHVLPQTFSFLMVALTLSVPGYILMESGLSFLGLGIQQPDASWGNMLKEAQNLTNVLYRPWMLAPGGFIFIAVLAFNILGDAVRDALDPKSQQRV